MLQFYVKNLEEDFISFHQLMLHQY